MLSESCGQRAVRLLRQIRGPGGEPLWPDPPDWASHMPDLERQQHLLNVISYSSAMSACEKGALPEQAVPMLRAAISTCEKGAEPEQALQLQRETLRQSVKPDVISFAGCSAPEVFTAPYMPEVFLLDARDAKWLEEKTDHGSLASVLVLRRPLVRGEVAGEKVLQEQGQAREGQGRQGRQRRSHWQPPATTELSLRGSKQDLC